MSSIGQTSDKSNQRYPVVPTNYNSNDVWFKAATIASPICGAVILFVLIAWAIRILKNDNIHSSTSKLGKPSYTVGINDNQRKYPIDYEAYSASTTITLSPTSVEDPDSSYAQLIKNPSLVQKFPDAHRIHYPALFSDHKSECIVKKKQILSLEYTLLPESCHDSKHIPKNTDSVAGGVSDGINIVHNIMNPPLATNTNGPALNDIKIYEKQGISTAMYWGGSCSHNQQQGDK